MPTVIVIPWPCLCQVGHSFASAISGLRRTSEKLTTRGQARLYPHGPSPGAPQWHCPLELAYAVLDTPGPLSSQVRSSRSQEDMDSPKGILPPMGLGYFWRLSPFWASPSAYSKSGSFNHEALLSRSFPRMLHWGLAPSDCCSRDFASQFTSPLTWPPDLDPLCLSHPGCNIIARMISRHWWNTMLCNNGLGTHQSNNDLCDVVWRTPLERQGTQESTLFYSYLSE